MSSHSSQQNILEQSNTNVFQSYSYNLDTNPLTVNNNKNENTNELVLNDSNTKADVTNNSTVEDTLFTANTYGENDVDMVQDIINDIIQKEDLKKDEIIDTNNAREGVEEIEQDKKETTEDLFLEESILDEDVTGVSMDNNNDNNNQSIINGTSSSSNNNNNNNNKNNNSNNTNNNISINQTLGVNSIQLSFESDKNIPFQDLSEATASNCSNISSNKELTKIDTPENSSFSSIAINTSTNTESGN